MMQSFQDNNSGSLFGTAMPRQKLPTKKKNAKWREHCIDGALSLIGVYGNTRRSTNYKKQRNYDLYNGKFNRSDLEYAVNPLGVETANLSFPASLQPYDNWTPIFNYLIGEEMRRPFNFTVHAINEDAITEKEEERKSAVMQHLQELLQQAMENPEAELHPSVEKFSESSFKDMREIVAHQLLEYLKRDQKLDQKFNKGWEDALIAGEEIYAVESLANEPTVRRCNPLEIFTILPHNSDLIDDADVIVESTFMSLSQIVDAFYDKLSESQIDEIESHFQQGGSTNLTNVSEVVVLDSEYNNTIGLGAQSIYDSKGNIRVYKTTWKSKKRIGLVTTIDPETGESSETIVSDAYTKDPNDPYQEVKWMWINEYWSGYKIGNDMYIDIKPNKLQFRRLDNLSSCKSGYVGTIYNCNNSQSVSLMDRLVPYIYMYIILWYRTELALAKNWGKIALIDTSLIPDGWEPEKWLYYAQNMGVGFVNSYNEGEKGERTGKMNQSTQNKALDLETGQYIQQHIGLLQFLEQKMLDVAGVTRQRMGEVKSNDLVGNTQAAIVQSSYITEKWFQVHNYTKQRVLTTLIETAKHVWSGKTKKLQYITDELVPVFFEFDSEKVNDAEFGVFVSDSGKDLETMNALKQYMHAALQNDRIELSSVVDVLNSTSIATLKSKLVKAEKNRNAQEQQMQEQQSQAQMQAAQVQQQIAQEQMAMQERIADKNNQTKIEVAQIGAMAWAEDKDADDNGVPDVLELEKLKQKTAFDEKKLQVEEKKLQVTQQENDKQRKHEKEMQLQEKAIKEKEIAAKKTIASKKPKPKA